MLLVGTDDASLAKEMNISRTSLVRWLKKDDIKVSLLEKIVNHFGYNLTITLSRSPYEGDAPIESLDRLAFKYDKGGLPFLCVAMARYGITARELAEKLGLDKTTVQHMFAANEIYLSRVFEIAKAFDLSLLIEIRPKCTTHKTRHEGSRFIVDIDPLPRVFDNPLDGDGD